MIKTSLYIIYSFIVYNSGLINYANLFIFSFLNIVTILSKSFCFLYETEFEMEKKNHPNSAWDLFSNLDFIGLQNNFFFRITVTLNEHSLIVVIKFLCLEQEKLGK